ncbi:HAMP domain-containing protein [Candidatus Woesebacteria bacterium]|nr:HAMP domain-containing protein [Candidatus Woesebacteria bacterium]QQG47894.1 MAG: HAMP domain-containing protein [Candidatus Woesebacteria bacterium]
MNTKSIRFRILFWCSLSLFLATALIFSSFYLVTNKILFQQVDKELITHANNITQIVMNGGNDMRGLVSQRLTSESRDIPGMVVTILDQNESIVASSLSIDTPFVSYRYLFKESQNNSSPIYINQNINNFPMRFVAKAIRSKGIFLGVVLVAHPIDAIQKSLNILLVTLGTVFVLLIIPTILAVHILATKILQPILKISDKMEEISSEHLDKKIINPNSGDEIEKLVVSFNKLLDRLQEAFVRERQFIGDVAHELKTPVATLRSGVELTLSKERTKEEYKKALSETIFDVNRLSGSLKNILDLAWVGTENVGFLKNKFNLSETMNELKEIAIKLATQKHITIRGKVDTNISVKGSKDKITRAILNVIDNAIKYTPEGGLVFISLHKKSKNAIVEIRDNGAGIPKKELPHIFERFYRGSGVSKTLGSGLGLAIAQNIIKAHQGDIKISSIIGKGTSVKIFIKS